MKEISDVHNNIKCVLMNHRKILTISINRVYLHNTININLEEPHFS